jgi:alpha-L-fucosidase
MWKKHAEKFLEITKQYPNLIMNSRLGGDVEGDFETPEQFVPATGFPGRDWEVCMTLNDMWGYNAYNKNWKPAQELVEKLVDIVSKGGNFLLNVGPTSKGIIPTESVDVLQKMGVWLADNGEAIYGTTASPISYISWCKATRKGQKLYLSIPNSMWKNGKTYKLPLLNKVNKVYALTNTSRLFKFNSHKDGVSIQLKGDSLSKYLSVLVVDFEGEPVTKPNPLIDSEFSVTLTDSLQPIAFVFDGNPKTTWKSNKNDSCAIIHVKLKKEANIQAIAIVEPWHSWDGQSQIVRIEYLKGNKWIELSTFKTNGTANTFTFKPTKLKQIRIFISNFKTKPQLSEIILFRNE